MPAQFIDTNILLRHILQDDPEQSPRATAFLERVERGEVQVQTLETVVFETVFTLERRFKRKKPEVRDAVLPLVMMAAVRLPDKRLLAEVFDTYIDANVSIVDAYHAVMMRRLGIGEIVTFDRDFERFPGIRRVEP